jgi:hypothetical protein
MHLMLNVLLNAKEAAPLREDPELERLLAPEFQRSPIVASLALAAESAAFDRLVERTRGGPGFRYTPYFRQTPADLEAAPWLLLQPAKLVKESSFDEQHNHARRDAAPWLRTGPASAIRVARGLSLTRIKLRPGEIGSFGEWLEEWVVPQLVVRTFEADGLRGHTTLPIRAGRKGGEQPDVVQLDTPHVLPPALLGVSLLDRGSLLDGLGSLLEQRAAEGRAEEPPPPEARVYRLLGCLVYESFAAFPDSDFARLAEAFDAWGQTRWAVSARVYACFVRHGLRGWQFHPLLERGSPAHGEHDRQWRALAEKLASNPANRLW